MSRSKDKERASQFIYRNGNRVSVEKLKEAKESEKMAELGLVRGAHKIYVVGDKIGKDLP